MSKFIDIERNLPGSKKPYTNPADEIIEETNQIVKTKKVKDVVKMSDKQFDKFMQKNKNIEVLLLIKQTK